MPDTSDMAESRMIYEKELGRDMRDATNVQERPGRRTKFCEVPAGLPRLPGVPHIVFT